MIYTHAATALVAISVGFTGGWKVQDWRHGNIERQRLEKIAADSRVLVRRIDRASEGFEADKSEILTKFMTITKEVDRVVEKPVYRNVCLDADGLRLLGRAIGAQSGASQPARTVPGSDPAR